MKKYLIYFSVLFFFIFLVVYAQVKIDIRDFKGVFSNGDLEDIPAEYLAELKNLRPINGLLEKTFGYGVKIATATTDTPNTIATYINTHLTNPTGYKYLYSNINSGTNALTLIEYNSSTINWDTISLSETFYQKDDYNPIVQADGIMRFLPGNVGLLNGHESKGVWYGYIDSLWKFDHNYKNAQGFYAYRTSVDSLWNILNPTVSLIDSGYFIDGRYYKYSLIYDGIQESLMKNLCNIYYANNQFGKIIIKFPTINTNLRITGMNIYRAEDADGIYNKIHTVDFLRDSTDVIRTDSIYDGRRYIHIPELETYTFESGKHYYIRIFKRDLTVYTDYNIINPPAGTGQDVFCDSALFKITGDKWNLPWGIYWQGSDTIYTYNLNGGAYTGKNVFITDKNAVKYNLGGGVLTLNYSNVDTIIHRIIDFNSNKALHFKGDSAIYYYPDNCIIVSPSIGNYYFTKGLSDTAKGEVAAIPSDITLQDPDVLTQANGYWMGGVLKMLTGVNSGLERAILNSYQTTKHIKFYPEFPVTISEGDSYRVIVNQNEYYSFFDTGLTEGAEHPFADEVSIRINGKFAKIINNRLWQGNIVLDPGGVNEVRTDWVSYSEIGQYDVNPVSNVISFANAGLGAITGLDEIYGNPVIMKNNNISIINIKNYPTTPEYWQTIESVHNIGNIAQKGYINVLGNLYISSYDGIYRFSPNNLAESDMTPTERLRISEPINDKYLALTLTQKQAIKCGYDQYKNEIVFVLGIEFWAYNINTNNWREVDYLPLTIFNYDENNYLMGYNSSDSKIYSSQYHSNSISDLQTKTFSISDERIEPVRYAYVTYKSTDTLKIQLYGENNNTVALWGDSTSLVPVTVPTTKKIPITVRSKKFNIRLYSKSDTTATYIYRLKIEHEGEPQ